MTPVTPTMMVPPSAPPGLQVVVPTDERAVRQAESSPPPISGGTLIVSRDDERAFVSDPDRDRVSVVHLTDNQVLHAIALQAGDEPGRLIEDAKGRVHVALRRGGAVATLDPATGSVVGRHDVCGAPRGIAYDEATDQLHVACAGGELVSLSAEDGTVNRRLALGVDLRDVIVNGDELLVTRFKSSEMLWVNAQGRVSDTRRPDEVMAPFTGVGVSTEDVLQPHAAWRSVAGPNGQVWMLNQLARKGEILLPDTKSQGGAGSGSADAGVGLNGLGIPGLGASAYGGGAVGCNGVVQTEITRVDPATGSYVSARISAVLAVDIAVSPADGMIAVARAGLVDTEQPPIKLEVTNGGSIPVPMMAARPFTSGVMVVEPETIASASDGGNFCIDDPTGFGVMQGPAVAVAFTKAGRLLVQSREPASVAVFDISNTISHTTIALGGDSVYDTGHELFHRDAGGGMACASCHMEGGDDGHTWVFSTFGKRRTQALHVGLEGTAPFHWQGDMNDIANLMEDVMVGRMGGVHQSPARSAALQRWLFELQPPAPVRAADDAAAVRGQRLFEGAAECGSCHSGAKLTDNRTVDVGTGEPLQVPSLIGIAYRAPFIHNGCASTLRERFQPSCGGAAHGKTSDLSEAQIDDLVAYLETL